MPLHHYLRIVWRRKWVVLLAVLVAVLAVVPRFVSAQAEYTGTVKLLVSQPEASTVDVYGTYRSSTVQDEVNLARNNFVDVLESDEVRRRTLEALALSQALQDYTLEVVVPRDTEFLTVRVTVPHREWAAEIANTHVQKAQEYFGEIRAQPAAAARAALTGQLDEARAQLYAAEQAVIEFENQRRIAPLDTELDLRRQVLLDLYLRRSQAEVTGGGDRLTAAILKIIQSLEAERGKALAQGDTLRAAALGDVIAFHTGQLLAQKAEATSALPTIDRLIDEERSGIAELNRLRPQYDELRFQLSQLEANIRQIESTHQEAALKENTARRVNFIQVVLPASPKSHPDTGSSTMLLVLALFGSLGAGVALAFLAEYVGQWWWMAKLLGYPVPRQS